MLLAIGTAHRACSLALIEGNAAVRHIHDVIGRGHAERLIPMIAGLVEDTPVDGIAVEVGPGSFTGMRVGIAAARALGLAWNVPVGGFLSTEVLAAKAYAAHPGLDSLAVILDGGRSEVFIQSFGPGPRPRDEIRAVSAASVEVEAEAAIGTGVPLVTLAAGTRDLGDVIPDAADVRLLGWADRQQRPPLPAYVRAPDAKPPTRR